MSVDIEQTSHQSQRSVALRALATQPTRNLVRLLGSPHREEVLAAAEVLTERYLPAILATCRKRLPADDVGDGVTASAARFFVRLKAGRGVTSPGGLARRIAADECSVILRKRGTRLVAAAGETDDRDVADVVHARGLLRAASDKLPAADRVVLRDTILDRPSAETASELGVSPGAVDVRRARLRKSLRSEFET